jgi:hypothetical protein
VTGGPGLSEVAPVTFIGFLLALAVRMIAGARTRAAINPAEPVAQRSGGPGSSAAP